MKPSDHAAYFAAQPPAVAALLRSIQAEVERLIPEAEPCIAYQMPAYRLDKVFFYFAGFRHHIGIYPPVTRDAELITELAPWRGPKGNLSFPLAQDLPIDLIGRVASALARQYARPG